MEKKNSKIYILAFPQCFMKNQKQLKIQNKKPKNDFKKEKTKNETNKICIENSLNLIQIGPRQYMVTYDKKETNISLSKKSSY